MINKNNTTRQSRAASLGKDRQRLLKLIVEQGVLHDSEQHPLIARDGETRLSWVMNFLAISLHADHLKLAAQQMLILLHQFEGRQLATIGSAAVPLLSACVLASKGKYHGLMVRSERKAYGTASLVDGRIDYAEPVVVIDDSIGSGTNMLDCINKLEQAGLYVEGCVCLVRFGYDSGYTKLVEQGYRVSALFDNAVDLSPYHPTDWQYDPYPLYSRFKQIAWDEQQIADHLSPFQVIRQSMRHYWETGRLLKSPQCFNQPLDTSGGVWLSLRSQDTLYTSQGRQGFWHFPNESMPEATLDVSRVAWLFAQQLQDNPQREQLLQQCALALSLFGRLESCYPGEVAQREYGLVIRSNESLWKMGGALPNMPGIHSDSHLLHHARFNNTQLALHEPYQLYRHTVDKLIEPGAEWPIGGVSQANPGWDEDSKWVTPLAETLLVCVQDWHQRDVWPDEMTAQYISAQCQWLFLSVYGAGKQLACVGMAMSDSADLLMLVKVAARDERWVAAKKKVSECSGEDALYIRLALLSDRQYLGQAERLDSFQHFVPGREAISIQYQQQFALFLPEVPLEQQWVTAQLSDALYQKAGIEQQQLAVSWHSYHTATWHTDAQGCQVLSPETRLPAPQHNAAPEALISACYHYLQQHRQENAGISSYYNPSLHQVSQQDALFNTAYILWLIDADAQSDSEWQACYRYLEQGLAKAELSGIEQGYCVLALLKQLPRVPACRALIAHQLPGLEARFNRHGQLVCGDSLLARTHYAVELYALLQAAAQELHVDRLLLKKALSRLLTYASFQATPCQYPLLLQVFALAKALAESKVIRCETAVLQASIDKLAQSLLQWQQPDGAFLPETPELSPVVFSAQVMNALLDAGLVSESARLAVLAYLKQHMIQPVQQHYFPVPEYACGGVYSGLFNGYLPTVASAHLFRLLQRPAARKSLVREYSDVV